MLIIVIVNQLVLPSVDIQQFRQGACFYEFAWFSHEPHNQNSLEIASCILLFSYLLAKFSDIELGCNKF